MNIEIEYCYRDFGNFKSYNSVIFGNLSNMPIGAVHENLLRLMGEDRTFVASKLSLPEMFFTDSPYDPDLDWEMHEYCAATETDTLINDALGRDIRELMSQMEQLTLNRQC